MSDKQEKSIDLNRCVKHNTLDYQHSLKHTSRSKK